MHASKLRRGHLAPSDVFRIAWQGLRSRPQRSILAALGIAVGIAAFVALVGISASNRAALMLELDEMGANLLVVEGAPGPDKEIVPLPPAAEDSISRQDLVQSAGGLKEVPDGLHVYRTDLVPEGETNGLDVWAATPQLLETLGSSMAAGQWFDSATRRLPTVVLGSEAAKRLGVDQVGDRLWIGNEWYSVIGIMEPMGLAQEIDTSVLLGDQWVENRFPVEQFADGPAVGDWSRIYVQSVPGRVEDVRAILAAAASPGSQFVAVSALSDIGAGRKAADDTLQALGMSLGAIALLVGGVGIANTMVVSVMERRGEIGLRRSLGARGGQIVSQFLAEAIALSLLGAVAGVLSGFGIAAGMANATAQPFEFPLQATGLALAVAVLIGAIAGLQPALKAAKMTPTEALRGV